ncbi:protein S40-4 [Corylus avellana]|uniref:protein S40-4 n=1 Tax=Corylus avellana TaxID=13451 RepID=UPI001E20275D|nr:protein S40-4 [Corylus avellana]
MASRKIFHANQIASDDVFEFDEADVWNIPNHVSPLETKKTLPSIWRQPKIKVIPTRKIHNVVGDRITTPVAAASLPVNIPDWSKILKEDYKEHRARESDEDHAHDADDEDDHDNRLPPHEYLARTRGASFSVHEGIGRTLKGRDLRQVRNAIWKKVGFED